jgi:hypothetical protein
MRALLHKDSHKVGAECNPNPIMHLSLEGFNLLKDHGRVMRTTATGIYKNYKAHA